MLCGSGFTSILEEFAFLTNHITCSLTLLFHPAANPTHTDRKAALVSPTSGWAEGSLSRTPEHACQRSTSPHHQSPQMQRGLWFDRERILPSLHYPQTCTIQIGRKNHISLRLESSTVTVYEQLWIHERKKGNTTTNLAFMPGLTSTVLSEAWTTRTVTSPDSGWFCRLRKSFTRFSRKVPSLVDGNPRNIEVKSSVVTKVKFISVSLKVQYAKSMQCSQHLKSIILLAPHPLKTPWMCVLSLCAVQAKHGN